MSYTYLQEREGGFLEECFSDTPQFALWKLNHTAGKSCSKDNETESCHDSPSGTTFEPLTASHGEDGLMSFAEDSHARTSHAPEKEPESKASDLECGWKWHGSFVTWDRATSSWKTRQCSLLAGLDEFSETWPRWGMMRDGECLEQKIPSGILAIRSRITSVSVCGFTERVPTPTVCGNYNRKGASKTSGDGLATHCKRYPTPQASDNRDRGNLGSGAIQRRKEKGKQIGLSQSVSDQSGALNPRWTEWLMGWPIEWTDLKPSGTGKFLAWLRSHGKRLEEVNRD